MTLFPIKIAISVLFISFLRRKTYLANFSLFFIISAISPIEILVIAVSKPENHHDTRIKRVRIRTIIQIKKKRLIERQEYK